MRILTPEQEALIRRERDFLNNLRTTLVQIDATAEDQQTLRQSIEQLDDFFLIVVVGEFNAGKSALINALLGEAVLREGVTPTTTQVNILRFGDQVARQALNENLLLLTAPVNLLRELSVVDTPGTNAIIREHELITTRFLPRADLVLFITSADRPFTESERAFLQQIKDWGKKVVVIVNRIDILDSEADLEKILEFIGNHSKTLLGLQPNIFPVSARLALKAKQGDPQLWADSRFEALEKYIEETLDETGRLQLKFLNPLGVAGHLLSRYLELAEDRLELLDDDMQVLEDIEHQLEIYRQDMQRDFEFRMADIENILYAMEERGTAYFDETFRLVRILDLLNKNRIQEEYARKVIADVPRQIDDKVDELVDWLVEADLRQWQAVAEHLAERRQQYKERIIGEFGIGSFHYDRERLIEATDRETQRVVDSYDRHEEAQKIAERAQTSVAAAAALEVGAIGLGAVISAIATTVAADVTGILLASFVAALGLFVIPARRRTAKRDMHARVSEMRTSLIEALRSQFRGEIERSIQNVRESIAPYTRFVRAEHTRLQEIDTSLSDLQTEMALLKQEVDVMNEVTPG
ncbi:MAG: dynamin family protein [Anaerolineales bacterium]|jgi:small GTP-binding protein